MTPERLRQAFDGEATAVSAAWRQDDDPVQTAYFSDSWSKASEVPDSSEEEVPDTSETEPRFLIYSVTKTMIAVLVLGLRDERRLDLGDTLGRWFPDLPAAGETTLRHLLNHTGGLRDYGGLAAYH